MQNDKLLACFVSDLKDILMQLEKMDFGFAKTKLKTRIKEIETGSYLRYINPKSDAE